MWSQRIKVKWEDFTNHADGAYISTSGIFQWGINVHKCKRSFHISFHTDKKKNFLIFTMLTLVLNQNTNTCIVCVSQDKFSS